MSSHVSSIYISNHLKVFDLFRYGPVGSHKFIGYSGEYGRKSVLGVEDGVISDTTEDYRI